MNTAIIIQARMNSTRLPEKIMKNILDKPMIFYLFERILEIKTINHIILATSINPDNKKLIKFITKKFPNIKIIIGSETNVLSRFLTAINKFNLNYIIRVTGDNPLLYYEKIDDLLNHTTTNNIDYLSFKNIPLGMGYEIFNAIKLKNNLKYMEKKYFKEHVTPYFYENPDNFNIFKYDAKLNFNYRLTVDTENDFKLIKTIYENLYENKPIPTKKIIDFLKNNPKLLEINNNIKQKKYNE